MTCKSCNTLQHTAIHCNTLQHTATHCDTLQHTATHCDTLQLPETCWSMLQHTTPHCNTIEVRVCEYWALLHIHPQKRPIHTAKESNTYSKEPNTHSTRAQYIQQKSPIDLMCVYWALLPILAGSLKSEYRLFYRALLQKRLIILRSLLIVSSPYSSAKEPNRYNKGVQ